MKTNWFLLLAVWVSLSVTSYAQSGLDQMNGIAVPSEMVYGSFCGITGQQPVMRDKLIQAVINNDISTIKKWLYSDQPVKQAYGTEGYLILKSTGSIKTNSSMENKIMTLANSNAETQFCSGCQYATYRLGDVIDFILAKDI